MTPEQFGNYTLVSLLGRGGMAEVFLAQAEAAGGFEKLVAIKRLLPSYSTDRQIISMLADEARLSVWLNHANIVQVLDFNRVGKTYYIAMEYVEGIDLCDLIRPEGKQPGRPLPLPTALYVMYHVAEALDFAHRRRNPDGEFLGVIHRDVSPHNVLISTNGDVKLADFGLARASISIHRSTAGVIRGKFSYMPKEQAHGTDIDHRIDLFAAGVTLYEALTGIKPYTSTSLAQQLYQLEQPVPPPSAHVLDIPEEIDDLTLQAICPDADGRYQTAAELASDLRDALSKISTFAQEEQRLSALVKAANGGPPQPAALPTMSLADIPIHEGSLIKDEVLAVQQTQYPNGSNRRVAFAPLRAPTEELASISDSDGGDTMRFVDRSSPPRLPETDEEFDALATVAIPGLEDDRPATVLPPGTFDEPPRRISAIEIADPFEAGTRAGFEAPVANQPPGHADSFPHPPGLDEQVPKVMIDDGDQAPGFPDEPPVLAAGSLEISSPALIDAPDPFDTLRDPEKAGALARAALEDARTIQRSPDDALAAFQRALDEREKLKEAAQQPALRMSHWIMLAVGALLIFGAGIGGGWVLGSRGASDPPVVIKQQCPPAPEREASPQPAAGEPGKAAVSPAAPGVKAAARAPDARASAAAPDARASAAAPDAAVAARKPPAGKVIRSAPRRPRTPRPARQGPRVDPSRGYLAITADGPAKAYIDDRKFAAPVPIKRLILSPGIHRVRLLFTDTNTYSPTKWVSIAAGKVARIHFPMEL